MSNVENSIVNVLKEIDTYVICSTLNQIINYIPIKLIQKYRKNMKPIELFNITPITENHNEEKRSYESGYFKRFDNEIWDKNLKGIVDKNCRNLIRYDKESNRITISNDLENAIGSKIDPEDNGLNLELGNKKRNVLWNLTGGQRNVIFTIQNYIMKNERINDYIIYLEGNSNKIYCGKLSKQDEQYLFKYSMLEDNYGVEDLNLQDTFELAGFDIKEYDKKFNYLIDDSKHNEDLEEYNVCKKMYECYCSDKNIRKQFWALNKQSYGDNNKKFNDLYKVIENSSVAKGILEQKDKDILENIKGDNDKKFGYILEYMTIYAISEAIKEIDKNNYFIELLHSCNVDRNKIKKNKDRKELCEFDIVILSKSGQVVIFECKSGTMSSDVGKARQYTAYAVGGVYGKPILITPLLKEDLIKIENDLKENENEYEESMKQALRAAARANLEVWGLDDIKEKLKQLYSEAMNY